MAALSPAEGGANGHPDTPSPTAADSAATVAGVVADFLPEERNGDQRFSATPVDEVLPADNPRQTARPSANKAGMCPVKKAGVGAQAGTTSWQKVAPASATRR